jgi:hypothetical protein
LESSVKLSCCAAGLKVLQAHNVAADMHEASRSSLTVVIDLMYSCNHANDDERQNEILDGLYPSNTD